MKTRCLLASLILMLPLVALAQNADFQVSTDNRSFLKDGVGDSGWKRVSVWKASADSPAARFEVLIECRAGQVFFDEARVAITHKSNLEAGHPRPLVKGPFAAPDDWQEWTGSTEATFAFGAEPPVALNLPMHEITETVGAPAGAMNASAIRLNPAPSRPRKVHVYSGPAKAVSRLIVGQLAISNKGAGVREKFALSLVSQAGRPYDLSFDLTGLERSLAVSIHKQCGNP